MPNTTYYALVDEAHPADRPSGLIRRIHTEPIPTDEELHRDLRWHPTEFLHLYWLGHTDDDYVEISEEQAEAVMAAWREKFGERSDG